MEPLLARQILEKSGEQGQDNHHHERGHEALDETSQRRADIQYRLQPAELPRAHEALEVGQRGGEANGDGVAQNKREDGRPDEPRADPADPAR